MVASFNGYVDVVHVLIDAHADVHMQDKVYGILDDLLTHIISDDGVTLLCAEWNDSAACSIARGSC